MGVADADGERSTLPIAPRTAQALWRYLFTRDDTGRDTAYLFTTHLGSPVSRYSLRRMLSLIGQRAGVAGAHPHRLRHTPTGAINFLRNRGNIFALQRILGHESLTMVNNYLAIAQTDTIASGNRAAHNDASPVTNWLL